MWLRTCLGIFHIVLASVLLYSTIQVHLGKHTYLIDNASWRLGAIYVFTSFTLSEFIQLISAMMEKRS